MIIGGCFEIMILVSEPSQPSYDELLVVLSEVRAALTAAQARIADLEAQLRQNSKNSSRPASSDSPFVKLAPKSLRGKSGRDPGGQPGHEGRTLRQVAGAARAGHAPAQGVRGLR